MYLSLSPDGTAHATWGVNSSYYPYHYVYLNGELAVDRYDTPPIDIYKWEDSAKALPVIFGGLTSGFLGIDDTKLSLNHNLSQVWFKGLRVECARERLEKNNRHDYDF